MNRYLAAVAVLAMLSGVFPSPGAVLAPKRATAQEGEEGKDMEKAREFFRKGKKAYGEENYDEAAEDFLKAYEFSGRTELLFNIGQAYRQAGDLQNAEKYFQKYLNERPDADNSDKVVQKVIEIQEKLAAKMGSVSVKTKRDGQNVFVNDEEDWRCQTPCSVSLVPGTHRIRVRAEGFLEASRELDVDKSTDETIEFELTPEDAVGYLLVETAESGGAVQIEGEGEHALPLDSPVQLRKGSYSITVTGPSGGDWTGDVEIPGGETTRLMIPVGGTGGGVVQPVAAGLAGTSVALLVGGAILGSSAKQTHRALQNQSGRPSPGMVEAGRRDQRSANVLFAAGATTLLASAGLFTWKFVSDSGATGSKSSADSGKTSDRDETTDDASDDATENEEEAEEPSESGEEKTDDEADDDSDAESEKESPDEPKQKEQEDQEEQEEDERESETDEEDSSDGEKPEGTPDTLAPIEG